MDSVHASVKSGLKRKLAHNQDEIKLITIKPKEPQKASTPALLPLQTTSFGLKKPLLLATSSIDGNCKSGCSSAKKADGESVSAYLGRINCKSSTGLKSLQPFDKKCTSKESFQTYTQTMLCAETLLKKTEPIVETMLTWVTNSDSGLTIGTKNKPHLFTIWDVGAGSGALYVGLLLKADDLIKHNVCIHLVAIDADKHMVDFLSDMAEKESISLMKEESHTAWDNSSHVLDTTSRISANFEIVKMTVHFSNALCMSMDDLPPCDMLVLNSVVHEIISYDEMDKAETRYNCENIRVFLNNFVKSTVTKKGTAIFFRDFVLPPEDWVLLPRLRSSTRGLGAKTSEEETTWSMLGDDESMQYVVRVIFKTETSQKYARMPWEDLAKRYELKEASQPPSVLYNPESELILNIESVTEMVASWHWVKMDAGKPANKFVSVSEISTVSPLTPSMTLPLSISTTLSSMPSSFNEEFILTYDSIVDEQFCNYSLRSFSDLMAELSYYPVEVKTYTSEKYVTSFIEDFSMELLVWRQGNSSDFLLSKHVEFCSFPIQGSDLPDLKASVVYTRS